MEWKYSESSATNIEQIDKTSSPYVVYVRKDIKRVKKDNPDGTKTELWGYMEMVVPREDWGLFEEILTDKSDIAKTQDAVMELYEMIVEG